MKEIQLTQGKVVLVDDDDFEYLNQWRWRYHKSRKTGYAERGEGKRSNRKTIKMHRIIMQTPLGMKVDHADLNGCNNQRYNLRNCTNSQNRMNVDKPNNNTSGYKGVTWKKSNNAWGAQIEINGIKMHLGHFDNPEDAARAYDHKAIELFGEFARINGI